MATGCAILGMLLFQTNERPAAERKLRLRLAALLAAVLAMSVAFAVAPVDRETVDFAETYSSDDFYLGYNLPYLGLLALTIADLTRLCRRYAQISTRPFLTIGMRLIAVAGRLGIGYVLLRPAYVVSVRAGEGDSFGEYEVVSNLLVAAVTVLAVAGATLPALGPAVASYVTLRRFYPLWRDLYRSNPGMPFVEVEPDVSL